ERDGQRAPSLAEARSHPELGREVLIMHERRHPMPRRLLGASARRALPLLLACGPSGDLDAHARCSAGAGSLPDAPSIPAAAPPVSAGVDTAPPAAPSSPASPSPSEAPSAVGGLEPAPLAPSAAANAGAPEPAPGA